MFPVTATPSSASSKRDNFSVSTPLNQVYPPETTNNSNSHNIQNNIANTVVANTPSTARTYKTRERLYYETDYVKTTNSPVNNGNSLPNTGNTSSSTLFEPFLRKQPTVEDTNVDELPPTASLHEFLSGSIPSSSVNAASSNLHGTGHFSNLCMGSPMVINGVIGSPMKSSCANPNMDNNISSSVFVSGGPQRMTRSVTIFGFPPNCRNEILVSFQSHGPIESFDADSIENGGGSNWIHIVYESEWAAQKALSRNGSIFQPIGVMIGVIPMQTALEKVNYAADSFMSPIKKSTTSANMFEQEQPSIFLKRNSNNNNNSQTDQVNLSSLPAESSLVTKAVNYIFGW